MIRSALAGVSERPASRKRRIVSQLLSVALHGSVLGYLVIGPRPAPPSERPIYDLIIRPNENKIIWYRKMPEISPSTPIGRGKQAQGWVKSTKTIIVRSPKPSSTRQLVLQQAPKIKLDRDIEAPNLIALAAPPPPARPPEPKPAKPFVMPPAANNPRTPEPMLAEPELTIAPATTSSSLASLKLPRAVKPFVAPSTGGAGQSKGAASLLVDPDSNLATGGNGSTPGALPGGLQGGSNLNAAIIGLNPAGVPPGTLPPGSRPGEFSTAPNVGPAASGEGGVGGITLPGVVYRDPKGKEGYTAAPAAPANPAVAKAPGFRTLIYDDLVPASIRPTLSAPLRPASRTIPAALEARFQGRLVYAVVIPAPNLPAYTGDWIVWFAEKVQRPGDSPLMRAPIPLRKIEPVGMARVLSADRSEARIQFAAILKPDGRFDAMAPIRSPNPQVSQSAMEDLKRWDFRPATRDGAPVAVDVVIEVPFSVDWLTSSMTGSP